MDPATLVGQAGGAIHGVSSRTATRSIQAVRPCCQSWLSAATPQPPKWRTTASAKPEQLTGSTRGSIRRARS